MKCAGFRRFALVGVFVAIVCLLVGSSVLYRGGPGHDTTQDEIQDAPDGAAAPTDTPSDGSLLDGTTLPDASGQGAQVVPQAPDVAGISAEESNTQMGLADSAAQVLEGYRDRNDCLLRQAGYLDLLGKTWGCVVEGPNWVDVVIVQEREEGSAKRVVHLDPKAWEKELGKLGLEP